MQRLFMWGFYCVCQINICLQVHFLGRMNTVKVAVSRISSVFLQHHHHLARRQLDDAGCGTTFLRKFRFFQDIRGNSVSEENLLLLFQSVSFLTRWRNSEEKKRPALVAVIGHQQPLYTADWCSITTFPGTDRTLHWHDWGTVIVFICFIGVYR